MIDFETIELKSTDGEVMVKLEWIGEGNGGDYDPSQVGDVPLLRYSIYRLFREGYDADKIASLCDVDEYKDGDWMPVTDGSYCTQLEATAPRDQLEGAVRFILGCVEPDVRYFSRNKRLYEKLSWTELHRGLAICI